MEFLVNVPCCLAFATALAFILYVGFICYCIVFNSTFVISEPMASLLSLPILDRFHANLLYLNDWVESYQGTFSALFIAFGVIIMVFLIVSQTFYSDELPSNEEAESEMNLDLPEEILEDD